MEAHDALLTTLYSCVEHSSARSQFLSLIRQKTGAGAAEWWCADQDRGQRRPRILARSGQPASNGKQNVLTEPLAQATGSPSGVVEHGHSVALFVSRDQLAHAEVLLLCDCGDGIAQAKELLQSLQPHVLRQHRLQQCLAARPPDPPAASPAVSSPARALLDRFNAGVFLLDADGQVVLANQYANDQLADPGLGIAQRSGQLSVAGEPEANRRLQAGLRKVLADPGEDAATPCHAVPMSRPSPQAPCILWLWPLAPTPIADDRPSAHALALLNDVDRGVAELGPALRECFDLTPAEAKVTQALVAGQAPRAISDDLGLKETTVRQYLKSVLQKTGTTRQAELVRLLTGSFGVIRA